MTKRHREEVILARWTVDAARLREFAREARTRYGDSPFAPRDVLQACDALARTGLEVVCREDALFVGPWCFSFLYNDFSEIHVHDTWMRFVMESGLYEIPIPVGQGATEEAKRIAGHYIRVAEEAGRRAFEERQAPTWSNRLLTLVEDHFLWAIIAFFFIAIPGAVLVVSLLRGSLQ